MANVFYKSSEVQSKRWMTLSDVEPSIIKKWNYIYSKSGVDSNTKCLIYLTDKCEAKERSIQLTELITTVNNNIENIISYIASLPYVFILTDRNGMALWLAGETTILESLNRINIKTGASFAMEHAGINAISMAIQLESSVVLQGSEHHLSLFSNWSCVCIPIYRNNTIIGYLDLSFHSEENMSFAVPMLLQLVDRIEEQLIRSCPEQKK